MISFPNIPWEVKRNKQVASHFLNESAFQDNWQDIYNNNTLFPTLNKILMILNGIDIIQMGIMNIEDFKFDHVIMIYISNMWTNDLHYQQTLVEANHYYETSPYVAKNDQKIQRGEDTNL